jgi:hypothetical protein
VNYINANGSGIYPPHFVGYLDVNADKLISAVDVLLVVNELNE